jgi:ribosomal protein RSM22 (predicted rRNA methylase)
MTDDLHIEPQRMLSLPDDLCQAIERALSSVPAPRWMRAAQELSQRYRGARPANAQPLAAGTREALGYAALIMPATYAQLRGALAATAARIPAWAPSTMLDLGSGPGTALWAASALWPTLRGLSAYEREPALIALGRELARESATPALRSARWERTDLRQATIAGTYDLVVLGQVLNELDPVAQRQVVAAAWAATAGVLLIVEPGTAPAFEVVRRARDELLAVGARTLAPCAHDRPCPLENDWCHFPQRLQRPRVPAPRTHCALTMGRRQVLVRGDGAFWAGCADLGPRDSRAYQQQGLCRGRTLHARRYRTLPGAQAPSRAFPARQGSRLGAGAERAAARRASIMAGRMIFPHSTAR